MGNSHSFSTAIAELIGLKDAIILQHFFIGIKLIRQMKVCLLMAKYGLIKAELI